ncbi:MAG: hypothetical protein COA96_12215 [SAR86 cluster bacterium]|uniref:Uncharacterized protein n=1 Tax=SAR86 cluster bacterium TaxID=2030880 RepID=A0A2A5AVT6_9GAMM|nr:MAG: hypothetical protein COA96_12215 [SAR86 cluster bacterium]
MKITQLLAITALLSFSSISLAREGSANVSSACASVEFMAKMVALNTMLPADYDDVAEMIDTQDNLAQMNLLICQPVILTGYRRGNTYYNNGSLASNDLYHKAWYFPNGQLFMAEPGEDTTMYYPNGRIMAYHWTHSDQAIFWPNGNLATNYFRAFDETWYYPDGKIISYEAGYKGGRWFYPFQRLDGGIGQEVISSNWGDEDDNFTFLNFREDGSLFTSRERIRRKLIFDDIDLLDVPGVLLIITRLYQASDSAKQFAPADVNITGAPY